MGVSIVVVVVNGCLVVCLEFLHTHCNCIPRGKYWWGKEWVVHEDIGLSGGEGGLGVIGAGCTLHIVEGVVILWGVKYV